MCSAFSVQKYHIKYTDAPNEAQRPQHVVVEFGYAVYVNFILENTLEKTSNVLMVVFSTFRSIYICRLKVKFQFGKTNQPFFL